MKRLMAGLVAGLMTGGVGGELAASLDQPALPQSAQPRVGSPPYVRVRARTEPVVRWRTKIRYVRDLTPPIAGELTTRAGITLDRGAMQTLLSMRRLGVDILRHVSSGWRSFAAQQACWLQRPSVCASPATSLHRLGLAIDGSFTFVERLLLRLFGWRQFDPLGEPWHWSYERVG